MKLRNSFLNTSKTIAAAMVATIVISVCAVILTGCKGRKMTNMEPTGETVEVVIDSTEPTEPTEIGEPIDSAVTTEPIAATDSIA